MSDTSEALPQARSGIAFGTVVRLLAVALGIMSTLALARDGFGFPLLPYLEAVIDVYDDTFKDIVLAFVEPWLRPCLAYLNAQFDWHLELYPHWKHAFVLLWLFFGSISRALTQNFWWGTRTFTLVEGGVLSLIGGVLTGTVPLSHPSVLWWPAAVMTLHIIGNSIWGTVFAANRDDTRFAIFEAALGLPTFVFFCLIASGLLEGPVAFRDSASPGLATLTASLAAVAVVFLVAGLISRDGIGAVGWQRGLNSMASRVGIDILAVLGGAAFIVWLGHTLA